MGFKGSEVQILSPRPKIKIVSTSSGKALKCFPLFFFGKFKLVTAEMVLAEVVWGLESYYKLEKTRLVEMLNAILSTSGREVLDG
jgi:predicted nucleic-acid-binding protein